MADPSGIKRQVNFSSSRSFGNAAKSSLKDLFFPDDPFRHLKNKPPLQRCIGILKYFMPILEWAPKYSFRLFQYDLLAGVTTASLAIPQGISYAKLGNLPPIIGLYSSFVPPLVYAVFGSSRDLAVGTVAASSLLLASIIGNVAPLSENPALYVHLFFTAAFFTGVFEAGLGFLRLGIVIDFLSRSTILGFMGGTAIIIILQQLKSVFGLAHFTTHTDLISVMHSIFTQTDKWRWESAVLGIVFLGFLISTRYLKKKNARLYWVSAIAPMVTVVLGCVFVYFTRPEKHGIQTVGPLKKGLNPLSIKYLNFEPRYLKATVKSGIITGIIALTEGIAIGRSFATKKNYEIDGNKEMIAFGLMNIAGSFTSCYLTTGPFSKSAVNYDAGCQTAMSNVVMSICMMLTLLFLAPLFSYTPLVALSAIIIAAMLGLIEYEEAYRLFKVDKIDFCICMAAFFGVIFVDMDVGLMISVGIAILRTLLYVARPGISKLGNISNTAMYRDVEQYPSTDGVPGVLILALSSPLYFANASYMRERISRWIEEEQQNIANSKSDELLYVIMDLSGVTSIDKSGIEMLLEVHGITQRKGIKVAFANPKLEVVEKFVSSNFIETIGKEWVFLSIEEAVATCNFMFYESKQNADVRLSNHSITFDSA